MSEKPVEVAGRALREHVSDGSDERPDVARRARFVEAALATTRRAGPRPWVARLLVAAAVCATVTVGVLHRQSQMPLSFSVGPERRVGQVAGYIGADADESLPLYFSDGTALTLERATRARVEHATPRGATVLVEDGSIDANVVHRATSEWFFRAGPYSVHVTGTSFAMSWHASQGLEIRMRAGAVIVQGPGLGTGVRVQGHEHFSSSEHGTLEAVARAGEAASPVVAPATPATPATNEDVAPPGSPLHDDSRPAELQRAPHRAGGALPAASASPPPSPPTSAENHVAPTTAENPSTTAPSGGPNATWSALVAHGEYGRVLADARRAGVDTSLATASNTDLDALATAARLSGDRTLAELGLRTERARFPGSSQAATAAFLLGRLADDSGNAASAVRWYDEYGAEAPGGAFAAEALGRRMLALRRLNDAESTRRAAQSYLARFPGGPYAGVAREILAP